VHYSPRTEYMLEGWSFLIDFLTLGFILNPSVGLDWWHFYHLLHVKHMPEGPVTIQPCLQQLPVLQEVRSPTLQAPALPMEEWQWVAGGGAYSLTQDSEPPWQLNILTLPADTSALNPDNLKPKNFHTEAQNFTTRLQYPY
jgi:hypothetical protein